MNKIKRTRFVGGYVSLDDGTLREHSQLHQEQGSKCFNPTSFGSMAVTGLIVVVYLAIFTSLLFIHENVPAAPANPTLYRGLNLTEAWLDLEELSNGYHPFNSRRNDEVRNWLLGRIENILDKNGVDYKTDTSQSVTQSTSTATSFGVAQYSTDTDEPTATRLEGVKPQLTGEHDELRVRAPSPSAVIFNDLNSNYTSTALVNIGQSGRKSGISTYFEGNNIIVYIRGTEDEAGDWWTTSPQFGKQTRGRGGIMINAHFDSVATGFGTTDDGIGIIATLQLIKYFTTEGNTPKRGLIALLNNGEEDGLYGAKAFISHPMASFVHAFLNLEGAGAGGRATLFRSTDTEVTRAYSQAQHPFGSVVSADGFALCFVRSETDYVVFRAEGYRGLDVAFWEPRARYHTNQDDTKHTSKDSLWHMLSASVETAKYLTSQTNEFIGPRGDDDKRKVRNGHGTDGVWFDLLGIFMVVFGLRTLFAWSMALLIATPVVLLIVTIILSANDKYYLFTGTVTTVAGYTPEGQPREDQIRDLKGMWGCFRFLIALVVSVGLTFGAAFLVQKLNPLIVYSSQYAVWTMSLSLFFCSFWSIMSIFNLWRPSALHRLYSLIWMFALGWVLTVAATVCEDRLKISGGYMFVIYESAIFLATLIGLCELFALPRKTDPQEWLDDDDDHYRRSPRLIPRNDGTDGSPTENSPLLPGTFNSTYQNIQQQNINFRRQQNDGPSSPQATDQIDGANNSSIHAYDPRDVRHRAYGREQKWSGKLPTWTWVLQFLILGPFILVSIGQVGLLLVTATAQTGTDGSPLLLPYLLVALFSSLLILPMAPFIHRVNAVLPAFLVLVLAATLSYNILAFPFSENNRYKSYFQQTVDLDTGLNHVTFAGIERYIREIISFIPSAAGQTIECNTRPDIRDGLSFCSYESLSPRVVDNVKDGVPPEEGFKDWLTFNASRVAGENKATFHISGLETKACIIRFDDPFSGFRVKGAAANDGRWPDVPESGRNQIKLWHRDWNREWEVDVEWPVADGKQVGQEGRSGRVVCLWSDQNKVGTIPALDEAVRFVPGWTSVVKLMDGLVEGSKAFQV